MKSRILHTKHWSLTARLLCVFAVISLMAWLIATMLTLKTSAGYIKTFFDNQQIIMAKTLLNLDSVPHFKDLPPTENFITKHGELKRENDDVLGFALFSANGDVLLTDGEDGKHFPFLPMEKGFAKVEVDDDTWRILWMHSADGQRIAAVGQEKEYRDNLILDILWGQISPWLIILPFLLLGFGFALYREFRPLRKIAKELDMREAHNTSPLVFENVPKEISPLIAALNTLFERIGILLEHERAFVANAAHELRTPLTGLKIQAEVLAMSNDDPQSQKNSLEHILQAANKCSHLIDQLLLLSQLENKFQNIENTQDKNILETVNWENLITNSCHELEDFAKSMHIELQHEIKSIPKNYTGLSALLAIALRNMLDNAIRHSPHGSSVYITLQADRLCVENKGISIDESVLPHLGKRFYRPAGQKAMGSGLGLAIVNHIANLHGATFSIGNKQPQEQIPSVIACIKF